MNRPVTYTAPLMPPQFSRRVLIAVIAVALIHVAAIYAVMTGLTTRVIEALPAILHVEVVKQPPPKTVPRPPPPPKAEMVQPSVPVVPPPEIRIRVPVVRHPITQVRQAIQPRPITAPQPVVTKPQPPPPAVPAPTPASAIAATHTIPPYPIVARRLNQQGAVVLHIVIGADGRVTATSVLHSSGHSALDSAAQDWVKAHWRYHPATQGGRPIASDERVKIVFDLRDAR